ncbi:Mitochondrial amidoxime-reducing component 1 [Chamberlinius hualienensis]
MSWSNNLSPGKIVVGIAAAGALAYAAHRIVHMKCKSKAFREVGVLSAIYLYPIKSCRGILLESAECLKLGLRSEFIRDREFMIVDSEGNFITARQEPAMILITPSIHPPNQLWIDGPEMETLKVTVPLGTSAADPTMGKVISVRIFKDHVTGMDCGQVASEWFSKYLGKEGVRLVRFHLEKSMRVPEQNGLWEDLRLTDNSIYADLTAYMMLSQASVENLNTKLENKVKINNFRPNLVVEGSPAFGEESWRDVKIGNVQFLQVKPCTRCILTTIDPETGIKDGVEPLKTLKAYRQITDKKYRPLAGESPVFGVHLVTDQSGGSIRVGQSIRATSGKPVIASSFS